MSNPDFVNTLYYGDNLAVMRKFIKDESIDLIYLDPPFNSQADYNILFKEASGEESAAQIQAFTDFWRWDKAAESTYMELQEDPKLTEMIQFLHAYLGRNDMLAYLVMMTIRLRELHRVLKPTGSLYLHCDPTASHYLKLILDRIFGPKQFLNEIVWKRSSAHSDTKQGMKRCGRIHDILLLYTKTGNYVWNPTYTEYSEDYKNTFYKNVEPETNRKFTLSDLTAAKPGGDVSYEFKGVKPYKGRYWAYSKENMEKFDKEGRLYYTKTGMPRLKNYLDEMPGVSLQDIWDDIKPESGSKDLGYPTQKPETLLERIISSSSNENNIVLDPFCGCGTATIASNTLKRKWIGIDVTHLSISLIKSRLFDNHVVAGKDYVVVGEPVDLASAVELAETNPYQFQWWALSLINARPAGQTSSGAGKKGSDKGVDGWLAFRESANLNLKRIVVQVKGGANVGAKDVRDLNGTVQAQKAEMGILITLTEPTNPMKEAALEAEYYISPTWGTKYPKIQIITIEQLLNGEKLNVPLASNMFREAPESKRQKEIVQKKL